MPSIEEQVPEILKNLPARVGEIPRAVMNRLRNHAALVEGSETWTYEQLNFAVVRTQAWLQNLAVRPGDRVMIVSENCRAFITLFLACGEIGAWPVLVNARISAREADAISRHCDARRTLYLSESSPHAAEHARLGNAVAMASSELGSILVGPLNQNAKPEPLDSSVPDRVAALIYTSGTTGLPKGVMLTHRNLLFVAAISAAIRKIIPEDRVYGILPMTHAVGLSVVLLGTLLSGATLYIVPRFDPIAARASLENDQLTIVLGVPAMFAQMLTYAKMRKLPSLKFPRLRIISSSGAPLDPAVKADVEKLFGLVLHNGYGVTECSPNIAQARIDEIPKGTSVGRVFPGVEVKLMDAHRKPVPEGEVGELWVRGPNVMKGYYRAPEETSAAIDSDGWFNTRDLARLEDGNLLFIVGRTKDLIVRFGFNVYPAEVEAVFNAHPAVVRSAVIGKTIGAEEHVIAFVELKPGMQTSENDLQEYAAEQLVAYKRPSQILIVPAIPVTISGKPIKNEIAKLLDSKPEPAKAPQ
jgi:acyl-CoA synthetase (AMP-forming)/AMP-acid ligase II